MCASSPSSRSAFFLCRIEMIFRPLSCPTDSAPLVDFWPTSCDSSVFSHFSSSAGVMFTASRKSAYVSFVILQRPRLVDRGAAGLVALDLVLRLVLGRVDRAACLRGARRDLLLDGA